MHSHVNLDDQHLPSFDDRESKQTDWRSETSQSEFAYTSIANQIMYSKMFLCWYIGVCILSFLLILYDFYDRKNFKRNEREEIWFIVLDSICVIFLIIEIILRRVAQQSAYWHDPWNYVDIIIVLLCIGALCVFLYIPDSDIVGTVTLWLRYITQLFRVIWSIVRFRAQQKSQEAANQMEVLIDQDITQTTLTLIKGSFDSQLSYQAYQAPQISRTISNLTHITDKSESSAQYII